jgi:hypothetical protein
LLAEITCHFPQGSDIPVLSFFLSFSLFLNFFLSFLISFSFFFSLPSFLSSFLLFFLLSFLSSLIFLFLTLPFLPSFHPSFLSSFYPSFPLFLFPLFLVSFSLLPSLSFLPSYLPFFWWHWIWTQGLRLPRQNLYTWATFPDFIALVKFVIGSVFMPWSAWTTILLFVLPPIAGDDRHMPPCPAIGWQGSQEFFAWAGFKPHSSWSPPPEWLGL